MRIPAKPIHGLKGIDNAIKQIAGVAENLNARIQLVAVAIVEHAAGAGNGDMSRALTLVKTIGRYRTLNQAFLVGWFRHFGNVNINLRANDGAGKVSLISKDSASYRGFDVDGARVNAWDAAYDEAGNKAPWYQGPPPPEFKPQTVGDIAARMQRFVKQTNDLLGKTRTVGEKELPEVQLTEADKQQVGNALAFIDRIAATLARHETMEELGKRLADEMQAAQADKAVVTVLKQPAPKQPEPQVEQPQQEQAVA